MVEALCTRRAMEPATPEGGVEVLEQGVGSSLHAIGLPSVPGLEVGLHFARGARERGTVGEAAAASNSATYTRRLRAELDEVMAAMARITVRSHPVATSHAAPPSRPPRLKAFDVRAVSVIA
jgi:hypothetical protein